MFNINKLIQKHASGHMFKQKSFRKSGRKWTEEGSGEIQWKAPTPEEKSAIYWKRGRGLWWNRKAAPMPEPEVHIIPQRRRVWKKYTNWWPVCKGFIWKPNLRKIRDARKTLKHFESRRWNVWNVKLHPPQIPLSLSWLGEAWSPAWHWQQR